MKRAILFIGWGAKGTLDAEKAALRLPVEEQADVFIVSDHPLSLDTRARHTLVDFEMPHTLRKAEGITKYAPRGYSAVLYLDSDITLLDDISFVFDKAELHGLAMAVAPTYVLDEYRSFGAVLEREGLPRASQVQYQAGLIAFSHRAEVFELFDKWIALGAKHSDIWIRDQPQLSLAIELCGLQPYVLSKNYNFRGIYEPVIGKVRVWHNFAPIPKNLNDYARPYPPRLLSRHKIRQLWRIETHSDWKTFYFRTLIVFPLYRFLSRFIPRRQQVRSQT